MKIIPIALAAKRLAGTMTEAVGLFIVRRDGEAFGFTSAGQDAVLDLSDWWTGEGADAVTLDHKQGLDASNWVTTAGLQVSNATMTTLNDGSLFQEDDIYKGIWREAVFKVFKYDYLAAAEAADVEIIGGGQLGEATINQNTITIELRDVAQALQQSVGIVTTKTCRDRLGGPFCKIDLDAYTVSLTVTGVTNRQVFTCATATQEEDWFGNGIARFLTGDNAKTEHKIAAFKDGVFTLILPTFANIQIGDTLEAVAGCRGRHERNLANPSGVSDCIDKFDNILNFDGEPFAPLTDELTASPNPEA